VKSRVAGKSAVEAIKSDCELITIRLPCVSASPDRPTDRKSLRAAQTEQSLLEVLSMPSILKDSSLQFSGDEMSHKRKTEAGAVEKD